MESRSEFKVTTWGQYRLLLLRLLPAHLQFFLGSDPILKAAAADTKNASNGGQSSLFPSRAAKPLRSRF